MKRYDDDPLKGQHLMGDRSDMHRPAGVGDHSVVTAQSGNRYSLTQTYPQILAGMEGQGPKAQPAPIHWAVGWADLMMTMFVLFLVMYLYQSAQQRQTANHGLASPVTKTSRQAQQGARTGPQAKAANANGKSAVEHQPAGRQELQTAALDGPSDHGNTEMARLYDLAVLTLRDKDLAKFADIELSPDRTVRIILATDLLFPSGNADLGPTAREKIKEIASFLRNTPYRINVIGHTDNVPIRSGPFASNWELSVMRATTVARFLIEEMGIAAPQFSVTGHSYYQPLVNNDTSANRAKNRRVEIIISREQQPPVPMTANSSLL